MAMIYVCRSELEVDNGNDLCLLTDLTYYIISDYSIIENINAGSDIVNGTTTEYIHLEPNVSVYHENEGPEFLMSNTNGNDKCEHILDVLIHCLDNQMLNNEGLRPEIVTNSKGDFKIYNYSRLVVSEKHADFLAKGFTFVPCRVGNLVESIIDLKRYTRKLNLKVWFNQEAAVENQTRNICKKASTFNPPLNETVELFERICEKAIRKCYIYTDKFDYSNLTGEERQLMLELIKDPTVRFMKPDKGNGVVVMDKRQYLDGMNNILLDEAYEESSLNEIRVAYKKIDLALEDMIYQAQIDVDEYHFLRNEYSSPFIGSKEVYPNLSFENGTTANSIELERYTTHHCHRKSTIIDENREKLHARKKLYVASFVCLLFMIGEVVGGYLAHSLAIMTDAAHLLTDFGSMLVSLFSLWISSRPATKTMSFGWHRSEILGALASVLSIWIVTGVLVYLAIMRIVNNDFEIEGHVMLITSGCAVFVNIIMAYILHQSTTFHSHSHRPGYQKIEEGSEDSPGENGPSLQHSNTSVRAAFIHVIGDLLQSIGVLVAAIIIYFKPECKIADPICTFLFSIFVLGTTFTILRDVFQVLMEGVPKGIEFNSVKEVLLSIKGVKAVHSLHLWALTVSKMLLSVHIAIGENADAQKVLKEATAALQDKFGFCTTTIQVEIYEEDMAHCIQCQDPKD
ncbi:zinc transporter 3 [Protopterus annectens]|uniref:zinc transporter 3 n=1 Tax=Protopterus annectens TaxID=7888 RepID=UPI001CFAF2FF|nr:zinc transporter 3 [Protopterus annectens]